MLATATAVTSLFPLTVATAASTMSIALLLLQLVFPHAPSNFLSPFHPVLLCFTTSLSKVLDRTHVTLISTMTEKYGSYANDETLDGIFNKRAANNRWQEKTYCSAHKYYRPVFPSLIWLCCPVPPWCPTCEAKWMVVVKVHTCTPIVRASPSPQLFIHIEIGWATTGPRT